MHHELEFCCTQNIKILISDSQTILGPCLNQQHIRNQLYARTVGLYDKIFVATNYIGNVISLAA